jgi:tetratricopeptide (TPR) repeat protein
MSLISRILARLVGQADRTPDPFHDAVRSGDQARDDKNWEAAVTSYRRALQVNPSELPISVQLGHALKELGDYEEAERAYRLFLSAHPTDADIHLQMGHLFKKQGDTERAVTAYEQVLAIADAPAQIRRDAERELESIADAPRQELQRQLTSLLNSQQWTKARELVSVLEPDAKDALSGFLGNVCKELGDFDRAAYHYERYLAFSKSGPKNFEFDAELQLGHFEKVRGNYAVALEHFIRAHALYPETRGVSVSETSLTDEVRICLAEICPPLLKPSGF